MRFCILPSHAGKSRLSTRQKHSQRHHMPLRDAVQERYLGTFSRVAIEPRAIGALSGLRVLTLDLPPSAKRCSVAPHRRRPTPTLCATRCAALDLPRRARCAATRRSRKMKWFTCHAGTAGALGIMHTKRKMKANLMQGVLY